jgi:hypothetical protein
MSVFSRYLDIVMDKKNLSFWQPVQAHHIFCARTQERFRRRAAGSFARVTGMVEQSVKEAVGASVPRRTVGDARKYIHFCGRVTAPRRIETGECSFSRCYRCGSSEHTASECRMREAFRNTRAKKAKVVVYLDSSSDSE